MGQAERRALVQHEVGKIECVEPNKARALQMAEIRALIQHKFGCKAKAADTGIRPPTPSNGDQSPSSTPAPGIGNWIEGIQPNPDSGLTLD